MLREISEDDFRAGFSKGAPSAVLLAAPNFEERSIGSIDYILRHCPSPAESFRVFITTLQAGKPKELLDAIKDANLEYACNALAARNVVFSPQKVLYPKIDYRASFDALKQFVEEREGEFDLYIDISAFPRLMIFDLLKYIMAFSAEGAADTLSVNRILFFYSDPIQYPSSVNIELLGDLQCMFSRNAFYSDALKYRLIDNIVFLNGNSHDVMQTRSISMSDVRPADVNNHYFIYINKEDFGFSYQKLWQNLGALEDIRETAGHVRVVFDIDDLCKQIFETVDTIIDRQSGIKESALYFGCFGPKIVGLSCFIAMKYYKSKGGAACDLLTPRNSQYTSLYSHGLKSTKLYEFINWN